MDNAGVQTRAPAIYVKNEGGSAGLRLYIWSGVINGDYANAPISQWRSPEIYINKTHTLKLSQRKHVGKVNFNFYSQLK